MTSLLVLASTMMTTPVYHYPKTMTELASAQQLVGKLPFRSRATRLKYLLARVSRSSPRQVANIEQQLRTKNYVITPNRFPYDLLIQYIPNCHMDVLWYNQKAKGEIPGIIQDLYISKYGRGDVIWFEHKTEFKTVKQVPHYHVIYSSAK